MAGKGSAIRYHQALKKIKELEGKLSVAYKDIENLVKEKDVLYAQQRKYKEAFLSQGYQTGGLKLTERLRGREASATIIDETPIGAPFHNDEQASVNFGEMEVKVLPESVIKQLYHDAFKGVNGHINAMVNDTKKLIIANFKKHHLEEYKKLKLDKICKGYMPERDLARFDELSKVFEELEGD